MKRWISKSIHQTWPIRVKSQTSNRDLKSMPIISFISLHIYYLYPFRSLAGVWLFAIACQHRVQPGADPGIYFWRGQNKVPNRKLRAKPESRARSARVSRAARVKGAKRPRIEGEARTEGEAREKAGEGSGEGARWAPPQKIFENQTWNHSFWCIFEAIIWND